MEYRDPACVATRHILTDQNAAETQHLSGWLYQADMIMVRPICSPFPSTRPLLALRLSVRACEFRKPRFYKPYGARLRIQAALRQDQQVISDKLGESLGLVQSLQIAGEGLYG